MGVCQRLLGKSSPLIKTGKWKELLDIDMERGNAWSCGSHFVTMRAELTRNVSMWKMSEWKDGRARDLYDIVELLPQPWNIPPWKTFAD